MLIIKQKPLPFQMLRSKECREKKRRNRREKEETQIIVVQASLATFAFTHANDIDSLHIRFRDFSHRSKSYS